MLFAVAAQAASPNHVPHRVLVKFKSGIASAQIQSILNQHNALSKKVLDHINVQVLKLPAGKDEQAVVDDLKLRREVEFAELDLILSHQSVVPNDTWFSSEQYMPLIQAPDAWSVTTGVNSITVALVDTGVFAIHPDLQAKMVPGWNIYDNNSSVGDVKGNGTWAAGVIAPSTNNGGGVAGVCWGCMLMPVRVSDLSGNAIVSDIASGITWAADHGAKIANLGYAATDSSVVSSAAQYLWSKGGITVAPSGNQGTFDASADNPYILTVGGTDPFTDMIWSGSNTGNNVDLSATATATYTTLNGGGYGPDNSATCISAAIVSGVAALVWSVNSNLTPMQVTSILEKSSDQKIGTQGTWNSTYGWGRVNALKAVQAAQAAGGATSPCDVNGDASTNVVDVQQDVNAALGITACSSTFDINKDSLCNVIDVQRVVNAALGGQCVSP